MTHEPVIFTTQSPEETERLGYVLGGLLPAGTLVALRGDLASGKTCLVRGMAMRFAQGELVSSPTFTLVNQYGDTPRLYHMDLYRLHSEEELSDVGYEELFESEGVCVVEWAERAEALLPATRLDIFLAHVDENRRTLTFQDTGILPSGWVEILQSSLSKL